MLHSRLKREDITFFTTSSVPRITDSQQWASESLLLRLNVQPLVTLLRIPIHWHLLSMVTSPPPSEWNGGRRKNKQCTTISPTLERVTALSNYWITGLPPRSGWSGERGSPEITNFQSLVTRVTPSRKKSRGKTVALGTAAIAQQFSHLFAVKCVA